MSLVIEIEKDNPSLDYLSVKIDNVKIGMIAGIDLKAINNSGINKFNITLIDNCFSPQQHADYLNVLNLLKPYNHILDVKTIYLIFSKQHFQVSTENEKVNILMFDKDPDSELVFGLTKEQLKEYFKDCVLDITIGNHRLSFMFPFEDYEEMLGKFNEKFKTLIDDFHRS